jgi:hypothetical protein
MAMFQGENSRFLIKLRDANGDVILPVNINDIVASLYLESNYKRYIHWALSPDPGISNPDGLYDRDPDGLISLQIVDNGLTGDDAGFELYLQTEDTLNMPAGRYIIQVTYNTTEGGLVGGENSIQKGALFTLKKAIE